LVSNLKKTERRNTTMIVITGATGNVGRPLVETLTAAGEKVNAVSRGEADLPDGVTHHRADLAEPEGMKTAFEGAERLFLLARDPELDVVPVLDAAKTAGITHVVLLSSLRTVTRMDPSQDAFESAVMESGLEWTMLRPGGFHSNAFLWAEAIRGERAVSAPFGDVGLPLIDPIDIAEAAAKALTEDGHESKAYALTGPALVTPREQAAAIAAAIGQEVRFNELSRDEAFAAYSQFWPAEVVEGTLEVLGNPNEAELRLRGDMARVLGREPITFAAWAKRNAAAFR
jgi:uncharacterized protein YbjT (DUF2867 family)